MASQPGRDWAGHDLADMPGIKLRNMLTQLGEWTRWGFVIRQGKAGTPSPNRYPGWSQPRRARNSSQTATS